MCGRNPSSLSSSHLTCGQGGGGLGWSVVGCDVAVCEVCWCRLMSGVDLGLPCGIFRGSFRNHWFDRKHHAGDHHLLMVVSEVHDVSAQKCVE
jgi:hypothetical protein